METPCRTVLMVEDEALIRAFGADVLADAGFQVVEAGSAQEAVRRIEAAPEIAVLFTDINMPGSPDGLGLARLVRERWPGIKILVASGQVLPGPEDLPSDGRFLRKPYHPDDLVRHVRELANHGSHA